MATHMFHMFGMTPIFRGIDFIVRWYKINHKSQRTRDMTFIDIVKQFIILRTESLTSNKIPASLNQTVIASGP